jgi:hypothetical protein
MEFEDEQDLLILSKIYKIDRANQVEYGVFQKIFIDTLGASWNTTFEKLQKDGIIQGRNNYFVTDSGIRKFNKLKNDKKKEDMPFWKKPDWYKEQIMKWCITTILGVALGYLIGVKACRAEPQQSQAPQIVDSSKAKK